MDSPEGATGRKKSLKKDSNISENGFPPKGQLGGRKALKKHVRFLKMDSPEGATGRTKSFKEKQIRFLKMDSPRRDNWADEEL